MNKMIEHDNYVTFSNLLKYDNLGALYTKKPYDFNFHKITMDDIRKEVIKLEDELDYRFDNYVIPLQEHTDNIVIINKDNINDEFAHTDGAITQLKKVALFSVSADCENIMLYDPVNKVIGCLHSGWKGTVKRIVEKAIRMMEDNFNSKASDIEIVITPSIQQCCFEVEQDVLDLFLDAFREFDISEYIKSKVVNSVNKYYIDTIGIQRKLLYSLGIKEEKIYLSDICVTCEGDKYHSYRNTNGDCGRNAAVIWMR